MTTVFPVWKSGHLGWLALLALWSNGVSRTGCLSALPAILWGKFQIEFTVTGPSGFPLRFLKMLENNAPCSQTQRHLLLCLEMASRLATTCQPDACFFHIHTVQCSHTFAASSSWPGNVGSLEWVASVISSTEACDHFQCSHDDNWTCIRWSAPERIQSLASLFRSEHNGFPFP